MGWRMIFLGRTCHKFEQAELARFIAMKKGIQMAKN
jgi:hypothetical protein